MPVTAKTTIAARTPRMTMTISNSMRVKPSSPRTAFLMRFTACSPSCCIARLAVLQIDFEPYGVGAARLRATGSGDRVDGVASAAASGRCRVVVAGRPRRQQAPRNKTGRVGVRAGSRTGGRLRVVRLFCSSKRRLLLLAGGSRSLVVDSRHREDHDRGQDAEYDDDNQQLDEGESLIALQCPPYSVHRCSSRVFLIPPTADSLFATCTGPGGGHQVARF